MFTLAAMPAADLLLPTGAQVRTASVTEPVIFQLLGGVVIYADASPATATRRSITVTSLRPFEASASTMNRRFPRKLERGAARGSVLP